jgi:hypothetical protein
MTCGEACACVVTGGGACTCVVTGGEACACVVTGGGACTFVVTGDDACTFMVTGGGACTYVVTGDGACTFVVTGGGVCTWCSKPPGEIMTCTLSSKTKTAQNNAQIAPMLEPTYLSRWVMVLLDFLECQFSDIGVCQLSFLVIKVESAVTLRLILWIVQLGHVWVRQSLPVHASLGPPHIK